MIHSAYIMSESASRCFAEQNRTVASRVLAAALERLCLLRENITKGDVACPDALEELAVLRALLKQVSTQLLCVCLYQNALAASAGKCSPPDIERPIRQ